MKILALSDRVDPQIYSDHFKERFRDIQVVISCGDLPEYYLDFVVTNLNVPLFFVHGNHDPSQGKKSLAGGFNLDEKLVVFENKLIIAGLEGSFWYNGNLHQYTESEMYFKFLKLLPRLYLAKIKHGRYLDLLVTHAPPKGMHEGQDPAHHGFKVFQNIIKKYRPRFHLHGHVHLYDHNQSYQDLYYQTWVINCYSYRIIEID